MKRHMLKDKYGHILVGKRHLIIIILIGILFLVAAYILPGIIGWFVAFVFIFTFVISVLIAFYATSRARIKN
jgi:hypothetical protein